MASKKLNPEQVKTILEKIENSDSTYKEIGDEFGVSDRIIRYYAKKYNLNFRTVNRKNVIRFKEPVDEETLNKEYDLDSIIPKMTNEKEIKKSKQEDNSENETLYECCYCGNQSPNKQSYCSSCGKGLSFE